MKAAPDLRLEFFVEPFHEGRPGNHVTRAIKAVESHGLAVDIGPFGNVARGEPASIVAAVGDLVGEAIAAGASRVSLQVVGDDSDRSLHVGGLHDALDRMIHKVEADLGASLSELDREGKQAAARMLDEQGAFLLRRAIEDVADTMGVSRITIYNYLNAIRDSDNPPADR
jgi:uncharacterized protein YqgV (UPF0045/DUF77 family)